MKCIIFVFSGTGNTNLIAQLYKKYLTTWDVEIRQVGECPATNLDTTGADIIGLGYPVHGFNAPLIMWDFCKKLAKSAAPVKVFIFKSSGEGLSLNDYSSQKIVRMMERRGFTFIQERHYVMPYNMIFRHSPEMVKSEYFYAQAYAKYSCNQLMENQVEKVHHCSIKAWFVPIVRILWIYAKLQAPFMKVDMKKCIKCQKCVKTCPYGNISFDEEKQKFHFGTKCVLCVRCSFNCPTCAISIGLLNNWRINGSYNIEKTAANEEIEFPYFTSEKLHGIKKFAYLKYFKALDKLLGF